MSIFESLENLNVSEECFKDIMDIVEEMLTDKEWKLYKAAKKVRKTRGEEADQDWEKSGWDYRDRPMSLFMRKKDPSKYTEDEKAWARNIRLNKRADHADDVYTKLKSKMRKSSGDEDIKKVDKSKVSKRSPKEEL